MPFLVSPSVSFSGMQAPEDLFQGCYPQSKWIRQPSPSPPRPPWGIEKSLMDVTDPEVFSLLQG